MKLAEALSLRADTKKRISQISERLNRNAKVQEGDAPAEDPKALIDELEQDIESLEMLIRRINKTNCETIVDGVSLTDMIARKDALSLKNSLLRAFVVNAGSIVDRYSNKEIRIMSTVNIGEMQKKVDDISKELRELDVKIQSLNWTVDLI